MFETLRSELRGLDVAWLDRSELESLVTELSTTEAMVQERKLAVLAAIERLDNGGLDAASVARSKGRSSDRKAKESAAAGLRLQDMPRTREAMRQGRITQEHAEAATEAASRADAPGAADRELAGIAAGMPADLFAKKAREWADRKESDAALEERHQHQRRNRSLKSFRSKRDGGFGFCGSIDAVEGKHFWAAVLEETDRLYRADGGREGGADNKRTRAQRQIDALLGLVRRGTGVDDNDQAPDRKAKVPARVARSPKYQAVVTIPLERYLGDNPVDAARAELLGSGPLPDSILDRILCDADIAPLIVDPKGNPLWLGRTVRAASPCQWLGLMVRDGGCRVCGAAPEHCEAHHVVFWINNGPSNIGNLVLLCTRHHHMLHDLDLELIENDGQCTLSPRAHPRPRPRSRPRVQRARTNRPRERAPA